jgi:DNA-binding CsgD family transcriptional regulator
MDRPRHRLTEREKRILRLICDGLSNAQIAAHFHVSRETMSGEIDRMLNRLNVEVRADRRGFCRPVALALPAQTLLLPTVATRRSVVEVGAAGVQDDADEL